MTQVCCCSCIAIRAGLVLWPGTVVCCADVPVPATPSSGNFSKFMPFCGINLLLYKIQISNSFRYTVKQESRICDSCILFSAMPLTCWKALEKYFTSCDPILLSVEWEWAKPYHQGVLWLLGLKVLWSLGCKVLEKDNVLLLHPKLKVKVLEVSPCLTAWTRFTLGLLAIHFFRKKMGYF